MGCVPAVGLGAPAQLLPTVADDTSAETGSQGNLQTLSRFCKARRSRSRQLGLARVGPSGSEAIPPWRDTTTMGAREIITERSRGRTAYGSFKMRSGIGIERRIFP